MIEIFNRLDNHHPEPGLMEISIIDNNLVSQRIGCRPVNKRRKIRQSHIEETKGPTRKPSDPFPFIINVMMIAFPFKMEIQTVKSRKDKLIALVLFFHNTTPIFLAIFYH